MAIYSCSISSIGRKTHNEGSAGAHIRYIARDGATPIILGENIPLKPSKAALFFDKHEEAGRKNARVADKIRLALPIEHTPEQRVRLVRDFMAELTGGNVPWYAAIHQEGDDAHNPHVHIIICDKHVKTGKRTLCMSDNARDWKKKGRPYGKPVEWVRRTWEKIANSSLAASGCAARIDHRSLKAQREAALERGDTALATMLDRDPQIHIGPKAAAGAERGYLFESSDKEIRFPSLRYAWREAGAAIPYSSKIDQGRSRAATNEARIQAAFYQEEKLLGREFKLAAAEIERKEMSLREQLQMQRKEVRAAFLAQTKTIKIEHQKQAEKKIEKLSAVFEAKVSALEKHHKGFFNRIVRAVDFTGTIQRSQDKALQSVHEEADQAIERVKREAQNTLEGTTSRLREEHEEKMSAMRRAHRIAVERLNDQAEGIRESYQRQLQDHERRREIVREQPGDWEFER